MDSAVRRLVSIPETRQLLGGIGNTTVYELVNCGEIVKVNIGRRGFITSESLEAYMDRLNAASVGVTQREKQRPRADHPAPWVMMDGIGEDPRDDRPT